MVSSTGDSAGEEEDDECDHSRPVATLMPSDNRRFVRAMALRFLVMFSAFDVLQNFQTSLTSHGNLVLAVIYAFFAIGNLFLAAPTVLCLGSKWSLVLGSNSYAIFVCTHLLYGTELFEHLILIGAAACGLSAAILWTAQSTYIVECAGGDKARLGLYSQQFWQIFGLQQILSNGCVALMLFGGLPMFAVFVILSLSSVLGVLWYTTLPIVTNPKDVYQSAEVAATEGSTCARKQERWGGEDELGDPRGVRVASTAENINKRGAVSMFLSQSLGVIQYTVDERRRLLPLFTSFMWGAVTMSLTVGVLPMLAPNYATKGMLMSLWGVSATMSAKVGGLSDKAGKGKFILANFVICTAACLAILCGYRIDMMAIGVPHWIVVIFYVLGSIGLGSSAGITNVLGMSILSLQHEANVERASAACRLVETMGNTLFYVSMSFLSVDVLVGLVVACAAFAVAALWYLHNRVESIDHAGRMVPRTVDSCDDTLESNADAG